MTGLGKRIRVLRMNAGLSQTDMASQIGVSKQSLYKYEHDIVANVPYKTILKIANALNVSPGFILGWEDSNNQRP